LIDILAGLTLATVSAIASYRIVKWESSRRTHSQLPAVFTPLDWRATFAFGTDDKDPR